MRPRLRDFLETREGLLFSVAAYPAEGERSLPTLLRFVPDRRGPRVRQGVRYRKVAGVEARRFLRENHPAYLGPPDDLQRVPADRVARHLPTRGAAARCGPEARRVAALLGPPGAIGVTGSHLCGLAAPGSDIDLVAYGRGFEAARKRLARALKRGPVRPLSDREWDRVWEKRRPPLPREEFILHERRKGNRGVFEGRRFDLLYVRSWPELRGYRPWRGEPVGRCTLRARAIEVERPFDTPTLYRTDHPEVGWVMGFRHDFVDQVRPGEWFEARGRLERRGREVRLVVGRPDTPRGEWIRSLSLVEGEGLR